MNWITFCSQTGSEIVNISERIMFYPHMIVTNYYDRLSRKTIEWADTYLVIIHRLPKNPTVQDYNEIGLNKNDLITLHGFLRILPKEICSKYEIINGHPALITSEYYPELKGKDPQERTWKNREKYPLIGTVIHRVVTEVDEGEILVSNSKEFTAKTKEELYEDLRELSLMLWCSFLRTKV